MKNKVLLITKSGMSFEYSIDDSIDIITVSDFNPNCSERVFSFCGETDNGFMRTGTRIFRETKQVSISRNTLRMLSY